MLVTFLIVALASFRMKLKRRVESRKSCRSLSLNRLESRSAQIVAVLTRHALLSKTRGIHVTHPSVCASLRREALQQVSALTLNDGELLASSRQNYTAKDENLAPIPRYSTRP